MTHPRFNHVAMSLPTEALDDEGRDAITSFYGEVFGWEEMPTMTEPGRRLVLQAYSYDQFVFLIAEDAPMTAPRLDHFGMSVASLDELTTFHERAQARADDDPRVDVIAPTVEDFGFLELHSFYVGFLLPMMVEVQHWSWAEGAAPTPA